MPQRSIQTVQRTIESEGVVLSITYPGAGQKPEVRATLQRETDILTLIFQSRTTLEALDIGQLVRVRGALVMHESEPTIFNPDYTIEGYQR